MKHPAIGELTVPTSTFHPLEFLDALVDRLDDNVAAVVTDVGAHQMYAAQAMELPAGCRFLTSGGHGAMGFGLPAAIGAALASPGKSVVLVTGDASIIVNVQELATLAELNLPVKIVVLDNGGHGMVRQMQDRHFGGRHVATTQAIPRLRRAPGLSTIADAFGVFAGWVEYDEAADGYGDPITKLLAERGPIFLHVPIDPSVGIAPRMVYGKGLDEMEPQR